MVALMVFAVTVSLVQLCVAGVWARSIRVGTVFQAAVVGFFVVVPVTIGAEWVASRLLSLATHQGIVWVVDSAAWSYDPLLEEVLKVAPLVVIAAIWPGVARQLGLVDHLLLGAAIGAGFELAEATLRFGELTAAASSVSGGVLVAGSIMGSAVVPSVLTSLTTWIPAPVALQWPESSGPGHLLWAALAAVGVGWIVRRQPMRWLGVLPVALVVAVHSNHNANTSIGTMRFASPVLTWFEPHLGELFLVTLLGAMAIDRLNLAGARHARPKVLFAEERADGLAPWRLAPAVVHGLPWSAFVTWQLVLERRAALYAEYVGRGSPGLADGVQLRIRQLEESTDGNRWTTAAKTVLGSLRLNRLKSWWTVLWVVSLLPGVFFLVVAGWPSTRGLQGIAATWAGMGIMLVGLGCGVVTVILQMPAVFRSVRARVGPVLHEMTLRPAFRLAIALTGLIAAALLVAGLALGGDPARRMTVDSHAIDALSSAELWLGLAIILLSFLLFPPAAGLMVTTVGTVVVTGSGAALAVGTVIGTTLVSHALLNAASGPGGTQRVRASGGPASESRGSTTASDVRGALRGLPRGRNSGVRTVKSEVDLVDFFKRITQGGRSVEIPGYRGSWSELPDGTRIGLREASKSGGRTIDIKFPDGKIGKVHVHG